MTFRTEVTAFNVFKLLYALDLNLKRRGSKMGNINVNNICNILLKRVQGNITEN